MSFKMKYEITKKYLTSGTKRRSGIKMPSVKFIVAHDTGNKGSTALNNVNYYENSRNEMSASAHLFVDDIGIYECVPALTGTPEKAWHVLYDKPKDNELYGGNSNDIAIGVEYCYGVKINSNESYKRYVWVMAYICYKFKLDPRKAITAHFILDPQRKSDPRTGLADSGRTYDQLLKDVVTEYEDCTTEQKVKIPDKQKEIDVIVKSLSKNFDDVFKQWQVESIDQGVERGLFAVGADKKFNPDSPITRAEVSIIINRLANKIIDGSLKK